LRAAGEQCRRADSLPPVTGEVMYGHAWGPLPSQTHSRTGGPVLFLLSQWCRHSPSA